MGRDEEELEALSAAQREWDLAHGLVLSGDGGGSGGGPPRAVHAPHTLFPSPFPRACFEQAVALARPFALLYAAAAADSVFLSASLGEAARGDPFTARLLALQREWEAAPATGRQPLQGALLRSDYMLQHREEVRREREEEEEGEERKGKRGEKRRAIGQFDLGIVLWGENVRHSPLFAAPPIPVLVSSPADPIRQSRPPLLRQVEINTVAASFAALSARVSALHVHCARLREAGGGTPFEFEFEFEFGASKNLPPNRADEGVAEALAEAWREYGAANPAIVFLIQSPEKNRFDQLHVQHLLCERFGIATFRQTLAEMGRNARRDPLTNRLHLNVGQAANSEIVWREVAVVYFRAGYAPGDYPSESHWAARREIELSFAVKVWQSLPFFFFFCFFLTSL